MSIRRRGWPEGVHGTAWFRRVASAADCRTSPVNEREVTVKSSSTSHDRRTALLAVPRECPASRDDVRQSVTSAPGEAIWVPRSNADLRIFSLHWHPDPMNQGSNRH
jgi:hypothetical protein